jgi:cytoskeletal protein CcmA (bactofilin family)
MTLALAVVLFFGLVVGLAVLPLVPSILEWRRRLDSEPLCVVRDSQVDIRHFARGFRALVETRLAGELSECRERGQVRTGMLDDGTPYVVVHDSTAEVLNDVELRDRAAHRLILSCGDLRLPGETLFLPEIYAAGSVRGGETAVFRAVLAEEEILLDHDTTSIRWLHADRALFARSGCVLLGRASADVIMKLERGCRFERLQAPRVEFCFETNGKWSGGLVGREELKPRDLPEGVEVAANRWLVQGSTRIPRSRVLNNDLVATGSVRIEPGARVAGSVKGHKDVRISESVEVQGSVVAGRDIYIKRGCHIHGPVLAERAVYIDEGVVLGTLETPTTVIGETIIVSPGSTAHGTVWAHREGWVRSQSKLEQEREREGRDEQQRSA